MKINIKNYQIKYQNLLIIFIILINTLIFCALSIIRHRNYFSQGNDLGLYEQIIWQYSNGELAFSSFTNLLDIADRFRPIILFFAPIYKIFPFTQTLLILQSFLISLTILPIFLLCKHITKSVFFSVSVSIAFLAYVGTQSLQMNDFHELCALPFLLACVFYFLENRKWKAYWFFLTLSIMVREYIGFLAIGIAPYVFIKTKNNKQALATAIFGFLWSTVAIFLTMPFLGQTAYQNFLGNKQSFLADIWQLTIHPLNTIQKLFFPLEKSRTILVSFASFGFLPLFFFPMIFPVGMQFLLRFLDAAHPYRWTYYFQYSADLAAMLAISSIYSAKIISKTFKFKKCYIYLGTWLIMTVLISQIIIPTPIKLLLKKDYFETKDYIKINNEMLSLIPQNASVSTQNNLASHLAKRKKLYLLPIVKDAEYIAVDFRPNQDPYNFFGEKPEKIQTLINNLVYSQKKYKIFYKKQNSLLLIKK